MDSLTGVMGNYFDTVFSPYTGWTSLILAILGVVGLWKMFEKAGEAGWKALIPFYNMYILYKLVWKDSIFWLKIALTVLLAFATGAAYMWASTPMLVISWVIGMISFIISGVLAYNISLAYGHGLGYFLGIYFLQPIFFLILGFGGSRYQGSRYTASF